MCRQRVEVGDPEQGVRQSAVPDVDLGCPHEALLHVRIPWAEPPHQQHPLQQVEVGADRPRAQHQVPGEPGEVQHPALSVREHGPETLQQQRRRPRAELQEIALEVGADQVAPEPQALLRACREEAGRQTAAHPKPRDRLRIRLDLKHVERAEIEVCDPPGQTLRLPKQCGRSRTQHQEPPGPPPLPPPLVNVPPELGKEVGRPMDLVEHHQPILVGADETGHIVQASPVLGQLEIQVNGVAARSDPPRECRLAGLARPQQRHRRLSEERRFDLSG